MALPGILKNLRRYGNPEPSAYDVVFLAREAFGFEERNVCIHALPREKDLAVFFSRIEGAARPELSPVPITVDVLNASGEAGVALQATKILRWRGLDVVDFGNASTPSPSTRLIDWTVSYDEAVTVARALGCARPEIEDQMDSSRRERVTVILGQDYKNCVFLNEPSKP